MGKGWKAAGKSEVAQKKGAMFTKLAREIAVAAKLGGPDPEGNARLKMAIAAAKAQSCPKDTIERAIKKGSGQLDDGAIIEELTYEGVGPYGVGVIVECQTDNKNRTVSELRNMFKRHNGSLGETNSVAWMFERTAEIIAKKANVADPEEDAIEIGADSVEKNDDGTYGFYGAPNTLAAMNTALAGRGWEITASELTYLPKTPADLTEEQMKEVAELLTELDDFDDSSKVYATVK